MAEQEAKDNAARKRIVDHLNKDHHDSVRLSPYSKLAMILTISQIIRYLEHYCHLPSWKAYDGEITNVDLNGMTFDCRGRTHRIPFDPPMSTYREARERAVTMDKESLQGLDRSDITVNEFVPPTGLYAVEFFIISLTFVAYSQRSWWAKGEVVEQYLGSWFASLGWTIQPYLISAMLVIHTTEAVLFARWYLRRHSVNVRTLLWWKWMFVSFVEGQLAWMRFKALVAKKQVEKEKLKH